MDANGAGERPRRRRRASQPRPKGNARKITVCTALNALEEAKLDKLRGAVDRSTYLRWLIMRAADGKPLPVAGEGASGSWDWEVDTPK